MNIKRLLTLMKKRVWLIFVITILFSMLATLYSVYFTKPLYESSSRMIVNANPELMTTLMVMIKEPSFLENVVDEMDLNRTPEELSKQISASSIGGSAIVKISVFDTDPKLAAQIADTTAIVFKQQIPTLLGFSDINILSKAKINSFPINENHVRNIMLGFLGGLIAGVGLIFLLDLLDNTIKSERGAEQLLGIPVLGSVSKMKKKHFTKKMNKEIKLTVRRESYETSK